MFKKDKRNIWILSLFLLAIILIFCLALTMVKYQELLTGMSSENNTSSGFTAQTAETYASLPSGVTEGPSDTEQSTNKPNEEGDYFAIGSKEIKICLCYMFGGSDVDDFINTLNPPDSKEYINEAGTERWYFRQGVEIDVDSFDDNPTLTNYVYLNSTCTLQTDKDIGIGSTQKQVVDAYGNEINPDLSDTDFVVVGRKDHGLIFVIKDEKVSSMFIATYGFTAGTDILLTGRISESINDDTAQTSDSETETPITVDEINDGGTFYLGQSMSDVSSVFYDRGIEILQGSDDVLITDGFEFSFFMGKVNEILVNAPSKILTVKGLDFGDTVDRMTELYGTDYKKWELTPECVLYEYAIGDHYFNVQFLNDRVDKWQLCIQKNIGGSN